jgi:rhodanese-related sulfurtransferase
LVNIKVGVFEMVEQALAEIEEVETNDAIEQSKDQDCLVIDIRDVRERKRNGYIPGSFHCPRGMIEFWVDPESPYFKDVFNEKKRFLFHCAADWRSALTVQTVTKMGLENAAHIKGGLNAWCEAGGPFTKEER